MVALAYVTVDTPDRRLDLAVPAAMPVAELLGTLLRHGGAGLAQRGVAHGGWLLRRADGAALAPAETLQDQGVRDGEVLCLARGDRDWPQLGYDDVAIAIEESPDRGHRWTGVASSRVAVGFGAALAGLGCLSLVRSQAAWAASGAALAATIAFTALTLALAILADRAHGAGPRDRAPSLGGVASGDTARPSAASGPAGGGAALATIGLPGAAAAGFLAAADASAGVTGPAGLAGASAALLVYLLLAMSLCRGGRVPFMAGIAVGCFGVVASVAWATTDLAGAAAVIGGLAALCCGAVPALGVRLGGLPSQRLMAEPDQVAAPLPDRDELARAVARTDEVILGLLVGLAATAAGAGLVLASTAGWPTMAAAGVFALGFGLRSRLYLLRSHRIAGLSAAILVVVPLVARLAWQGASHPAVPSILTAGGLGLALAVGFAVSRAAQSPYLARAAEVLELAVVAAVAPIICLNIGLFGQFG